MNLFRYRKKVKIHLITVDSFYQAGAFVNAIESYLTALNPRLFCIYKCDDLHEFIAYKTDLDFFIHHIEGEKYSNRIYISAFNQKNFLPLPISTKASLENADKNNILNVNLYTVYILSLLANKSNHSEIVLLKKLFIEELDKEKFNDLEGIVDLLGVESIIMLAEIYRNAGSAFLDPIFFQKARQLETSEMYSNVISKSGDGHTIIINKAKSLADEGIICSHPEKVEQSIAICRDLLLAGKLSISKIEAINMLMQSSFEALRKFERN